MSDTVFDEDGLVARAAEHGASLARSRDDLHRLELAASEAQALLRRLRDEPGLAFDRLLDLTVVDRLGAGHGAGDAGRFEVVYLLGASASGARLRLHARLEVEPPELDSAVGLWPAANGLEREAFDLFGVRFRGHPGLSRILLDADFEGAPLRKDFAQPAHPSEGGGR